MNNLSVGDYVTVISTHYGGIDIGDIGKIIGINTNVEYCLKIVFDTHPQYTPAGLSFALKEVHPYTKSAIEQAGDWLSKQYIIKPQDILCSHDFKNYVGFNERYKYCIKCDVKQYE